MVNKPLTRPEIGGRLISQSRPSALRPWYRQRQRQKRNVRKTADVKESNELRPERKARFAANVSRLVPIDPPLQITPGEVHVAFTSASFGAATPATVWPVRRMTTWQSCHQAGRPLVTSPPWSWRSDLFGPTWECSLLVAAMMTGARGQHEQEKLNEGRYA